MRLMLGKMPFLKIFDDEGELVLELPQSKAIGKVDGAMSFFCFLAFIYVSFFL